MSGALKAPPTDPTSPSPAAGRVEASAEIRDLPRGLYEIDIAGTESTRAGRGMVLPCAHVAPLPPTNRPPNQPNAGIAHVGTLTDNTLIVPNGRPGYLHIEGGPASVLVTQYWLADVQTPPDVRIRPLNQADQPSAPPPPPGLPSLAVTVLAHIERAGDVTAPGGHWVGRPGNGAMVEGFSITPGDGLRLSDIEYQAMLGCELSTAWMRGGEFCGSRGMSLPTLGLRIRLIGRVAKRFQCTYGASFAGAGTIGPVMDGAACTAGEAPMEAFWVSLMPRAAGK